MDNIYNFIQKYYPDYTLVNITKRINSRNIKSHADQINNNPMSISVIERKIKTVNIFRELSYPDGKYMFLNKEKIFVIDELNLSESDLESKIQDFNEFLEIQEE